MRIGRRKRRRRTRTSLAPMARRVGAARGVRQRRVVAALEVREHALECAAGDTPPEAAPLAVLPPADHGAPLVDVNRCCWRRSKYAAQAA